MDKSQITDAKLHEMYLDYVNNFISVLAFASHYGITEAQANLVIQTGSHIHAAVAAAVSGWDK